MADTNLQKQVDELTAANTALQAENDNLKAKAAEDAATIEKLGTQLAALTVPEEKVDVKPTLPEKNQFTVDKKKYKFVLAKFILDGVEITAKDAIANEAVLKQLVEMGSGVIAEA